MEPELRRGVELRLKGHLYEIGETNDAVLGGRQGYPRAKQGYERTLREVADCADPDTLDRVAAHIKDEMSETGERPSNRSVRRAARQIVSEAGYPASAYLNRA
jgi:hypothetical protein